MCPGLLSGQDWEGAGEDDRGGDLPPNLLIMLAVAEMESVDEIPGVMMDNLGMLRDTLTERMKGLGKRPGARGWARGQPLQRCTRTTSRGCTGRPWRT
jgi:hypothetical protein